MVKSIVANVLGDFSITKTNSSAMVINDYEDRITFKLYQDLGTRSLDGSSSPSSGINEVEYDPYTKPIIHYDTQYTNSIYFKQIQMDVPITSIQRDIEDFIICQNSMAETRTITLKNYSKDVEAYIDDGKSVKNTIKLTISTGRYVELDIGADSTCTATNLPDGLKLKDGKICGITNVSGVYKGVISGDNMEQPYIIEIPQLQRTA